MGATNAKGTALVTGASSGIGVLYANRLAKRGYDLTLVARKRTRLAALAGRIEDETDRSADAILADLNDSVDLTLIESTLHMAGASLWRCIDRHF